LPRFTFGMNELMSGVELIPMMVGMFAVSELLRYITNLDPPPMIVNKPIGNIFAGMWDLLKKYRWPLVRGSALGTITLLGWKPSEVLQQALDLPAAQRSQPPAKPRQERASSTPQGGNSGKERLTVNQWRRRDRDLGRRLQGVTAPEIGKAHLKLGRTFTWAGKGGNRAYTRAEVMDALEVIARKNGRRTQLETDLHSNNGGQADG
jgi:hypothetical protein